MTGLIDKIQSLVDAGRSQREICDALGISRGQCQRARAKLGLRGRKNGPRCPRIYRKTETKIVSMLAEGMSQENIARKLRLRLWSVRSVSKRNGFHRPTMEESLSPELREKIIREIRGRQNHAVEIAHKFSVSYKLILKLAKRELRTVEFYRGRTRVPLINRLP